MSMTRQDALAAIDEYLEVSCRHFNALLGPLEENAVPRENHIRRILEQYRRAMIALERLRQEKAECGS